MDDFVSDGGSGIANGVVVEIVIKAFIHEWGRQVVITIADNGERKEKDADDDS